MDKVSLHVTVPPKVKEYLKKKKRDGEISSISAHITHLVNQERRGRVVYREMRELSIQIPRRGGEGKSKELEELEEQKKINQQLQESELFKKMREKTKKDRKN